MGACSTHPELLASETNYGNFQLCCQATPAMGTLLQVPLPHYHVADSTDGQKRGQGGCVSPGCGGLSQEWKGELVLGCGWVCS